MLYPRNARRSSGRWLTAVAARWLGDGSVPAGCRRAWAWPRRSVVGARLPGALDPRARPAPASCPSGRSMLRMSGCGPSLPAAFASPATGGSSAASTRRPPRFPALARAALACVLALAALATPAFAQTSVPSDWSLTPTGLTTGDEFRLLFLSSTKRNGSASAIATYNTFIQGRAAAGHADIRDYSAGFRVVGCTAAVDATANTSTTGTGVPIYWLNGAKVADTYADFYDGSWDDEANDKNESGNDGPDTSQTGNQPITGCGHDGTESFSGVASRSLGASSVRLGQPNSSTSGSGPLSSSSTTPRANSRPLYGLSAVFEVAAANSPATGAPTIAGTPTVGQTLTAGTTAIMDTNGLTTVSYTYQWIRVDGGAETNIAGAMASTYTLVAADVGKTIKVKVSFTDDLDNPETRTSAATAAVTADTTPPTLTSATVPASGLFIDLNFSEAYAVPTTGGELVQFANTLAGHFSVTAGGNAATVTQTAADLLLNPRMTLRVSPAIKQGQAIVVTYTDPTAGDDAVAIEDAAGNETATFTTGMNSVPAVTNNSTVDTTPPTLTSATVPASGLFIDLNFSEAYAVPTTGGELVQFANTLAGHFSVTAGGNAATVTQTAADLLLSPRMTLRVSPAIEQGQAIVVTYTDPTAGDDAVAIEDAAGNETATFTTGMNSVPAVTNNSTVAATAPGAPTGLTATASGTTTINLSWTAPADTGGRVISGYTIEVSSDSGSSWSDLVANTNNTTTTYAHTGLAASTTRHYRVSAINSVGSGAASNIDNATTGTPAATAPGAPTGLTATASGTTRIDLAWTAPGSTGGTAITGYKIESSSDDGSTWTDRVADTSSTTTTYAHTGLAPGTTRHYRVSAINTVGTGLPSNVANATTGTTGQTTVTFGASFYTAVEGGAAATVTVELSAAPSASVTIPLTTEHLGNATAADHSVIPATVTFGVGEQTKTFTVTATNDTDEDGGESVRLGFGTLPAGYAPGAHRTATVALADDDARPEPEPEPEPEPDPVSALPLLGQLLLALGLAGAGARFMRRRQR